MRRTLALLALITALIFAAGQSFGQLTTTGAGKFQSIVATTTTWNPSDKDASITLSNGNLTATGPSDPFAGVRSVASASSGKKYWEVHVDTLNSVISSSTGMGIASTSLAFPAGFSSGVSWLSGGAIYVNGANTTNLGALGAWAQGDTLCIAADLSNNLFWVRPNGGLWNADGSADPATGTGGLDMSTRGAGAIFAMATAGRAGASGNDVFTANFGATPPSGFGSW